MMAVDNNINNNINNNVNNVKRIDLVKYNRTIAHIYDIDNLGHDRVINLLLNGYSLVPVLAE